MGVQRPRKTKGFDVQNVVPISTQRKAKKRGSGCAGIKIFAESGRGAFWSALCSPNILFDQKMIGPI